MNILDVRNALVYGLHDYLKLLVVLSDQEVTEAACPYVYYQPISHYMPGARDTCYVTSPETGGLVSRRIEHAEATFSFSACSRNRKGPDGPILGDDEALELAERARAYFVHVGKEALALKGVSVIEATNAQSRTAFDIDGVDRRYGFDIRVRYSREDERTVEAVGQINITHREG